MGIEARRDHQQVRPELLQRGDYPVADRAQECEDRERRAAGPSAPAAVARREMDCNIRAEQEMDYLKRQREMRKNSTATEQSAFRDAETRIAENRRICMGQGR